MMCSHTHTHTHTLMHTHLLTCFILSLSTQQTLYKQYFTFQGLSNILQNSGSTHPYKHRTDFGRIHTFILPPPPYLFLPTSHLTCSLSLSLKTDNSLQTISCYLRPQVFKSSCSIALPSIYTTQRLTANERLQHKIFTSQQMHKNKNLCSEYYRQANSLLMADNAHRAQHCPQFESIRQVILACSTWAAGHRCHPNQPFMNTFHDLWHSNNNIDNCTISLTVYLLPSAQSTLQIYIHSFCRILEWYMSRLA